MIRPLYYGIRGVAFRDEGAQGSEFQSFGLIRAVRSELRVQGLGLGASGLGFRPLGL